MFSAKHRYCPVCCHCDVWRITFFGGVLQYSCPVCQTSHIRTDNTAFYLDEDLAPYNQEIRSVAGLWSTKQRDFVDKVEEGDPLFGVQQQYRFLFDAQAKIGHYHYQGLKKAFLTERQKVKRCIVVNAVAFNWEITLRALVFAKQFIKEAKRTGDRIIVLIGYNHQELTVNFSEADEVWYVPYNDFLPWYRIRDFRQALRAIPLYNAVTEELDRLQYPAHILSRFPKATRCTHEEIRQLLIFPPIIEEKKTLTLLPHYYDNETDAGLNSLCQLERFIKYAREYGVESTILITDPALDYLQDCEEAEVLFLPSLEDQCRHYYYNSLGVIGTNKCCFDLAAIFGLPIFSMAKSGLYPNTSYCANYLLAPYRLLHPPHYGCDWKASNVVETPVMDNISTSFEQCATHFLHWLQQYILPQTQSIAKV